MFKCKDYSNKGLKIKFLHIPQNPQYCAQFSLAQV